RSSVYLSVAEETPTSPSLTASKVPGAAEGCLGSICSLTRPLVAFSTFCAQALSTSLVSRCDGGTQVDIVRVVSAAATVVHVAKPATLRAAAIGSAKRRTRNILASSHLLRHQSGHQPARSVKRFPRALEPR